MKTSLFPMAEEETGELTAKMKEFLRIVEIVKPSRFINNVPNPRRSGAIELAPARKIRYRERSTVERGNSDLKDNYGTRHISVKGHWKVLCHLMFGVITITVKQLFNMLE